MEKRTTGRSTRRDTIQATKASPVRKRKSPSPPAPSKKKSSPVRKPTIKQDVPVSPPRVRQTRSRGRVIPTKSDEKPIKESKQRTPSPKKINPTAVKRDTLRTQNTASPSLINRVFVKPSPKSAKLEDSGDFEVSKLTYNIDNLTPEPSQNSMTPALTEKSELTSRSISRSMSRSIFNENSDEDDDNDIESQSELEVTKRFLAIPQSQLDNAAPVEIIASLLVLILVPLLCLYLHCTCDKASSCQFQVPDVTRLSQLKTWFHYETSIIFVLLTWGIGIASLLPLGRFVRFPRDRGGSTEYLFNGLFVAILVIAGVGVSQFYFKYPILNILYRYSFQLATTTIACSLLSSLVYFIRATFITPRADWNPHANTGYALIDFLIGREVNPKIFRFFEVKLITLRQTSILILLINAIYIWKNLKFAAIPEQTVPLTLAESALHLATNVTFNPSALVASSLQIIYVLDKLIHEHHLAASYFLQYEGTGGAFLLKEAVLPFYLALIPKYLLQNQINSAPSWVLIIVGLLFIVGISIKRSADRFKYQYRLNPKFDVDSLPTIYSKRLIVAQLWRIVRHPNHLGEILIHLSPLPLLVGSFVWPPVIAALYITLLLVVRAIRIDQKCAGKYQSAWVRYTNRVTNLLVPKVF